MLLPIGSKVIMTCSLQGIAMHRKPVHGRHSRIEVEMGVEKGLRNRQKGGLPGEPRVVMALYFILGSLRSTGGVHTFFCLRFVASAGYFGTIGYDTCAVRFIDNAQ